MTALHPPRLAAGHPAQDRAPAFGVSAGLSLGRCYLALHDQRLLLADWTLEADERARKPWSAPPAGRFPAFPLPPVRLHGSGARIIPSGTWLLPYSDSRFALYHAASAALVHLLDRIDADPSDPRTLSDLARLGQLS
jgi:hypothetical protein